VATVSRWGREVIELADLGNNGMFGRYSRGGAENVGESAYAVEEWRELRGESGKGDETEGEEDVVDDPSSKSSESEDLETAGIGGMLGEELWWGSQSNEPPETASGRDNLRSGHWLEFLFDTPGTNSESSSGVAGVGESVEDVEKEEA
jgi:hypothetical protein